MAIAKPLKITEVPEGYQSYFDYSKQWQEPLPSQRGGNKNRTMVMARCELCNNSKPVPVNDVRNWIRGTRKNRPGRHRACVMPGRIKTQEGYIQLYRPFHPHAYQGKYVPEHIIVMEESLGRLLDRKSESVHHINGVRDDNRIQNLQLRNRYHGKGQAWECSDCGSHNIKAITLAD